MSYLILKDLNKLIAMQNEHKAKKQSQIRPLKVTHIANFDIISGILIGLSAILLILLFPFFAKIIRGVASDLGYGSAKRFYFLIENFELISILTGIFLLINTILFLIAGYSFLKLKNWAKTIHIIVWSMVLIIFPIGTLYGIFALSLIYKKNNG